MEIKNKIEAKAEEWQWLAPIFLRVGIGSVFFLFGIDKFIHLQLWMAYMPVWLTPYLPMSIEMFMYIQGVIEAVLGMFLIIGFWSRTSAFFCALLLAGIVFTLGYNEIAIRDFGLLLGALALSLREQERWSIDALLKENRKI